MASEVSNLSNSVIAHSTWLSVMYLATAAALMAWCGTWHATGLRLLGEERSQGLRKVAVSTGYMQKEILMKNKANQTMRAVAIDEFGGTEKTKLRQLPVPEMATDEILVRVDTAGVGVWDPFEREGGFAKEFGMQTRFPHVLGSDGAGTVEEVGDEVHNLKRGDRVYGINLMNPKGGFYAEYTAI
jgi:hypothetical protein